MERPCDNMSSPRNGGFVRQQPGERLPARQGGMKNLKEKLNVVTSSNSRLSWFQGFEVFSRLPSFSFAKEHDFFDAFDWNAMKVGTKCKFSHHFLQKFNGHSKHSLNTAVLNILESHWYWALPTFAEQQVGTSLHSGSCPWKGAQLQLLSLSSNGYSSFITKELLPIGHLKHLVQDLSNFFADPKDIAEPRPYKDPDNGWGSWQKFLQKRFAMMCCFLGMASWCWYWLYHIWPMAWEDAVMMMMMRRRRMMRWTMITDEDRWWLRTIDDSRWGLATGFQHDQYSAKEPKD